jgi:hypothetical protein
LSLLLTAVTFIFTLIDSMYPGFFPKVGRRIKARMNKELIITIMVQVLVTVGVLIIQVYLFGLLLFVTVY